MSKSSCQLFSPRVASSSQDGLALLQRLPLEHGNHVPLRSVIWLWVHYNKIPIYPRFYLDYREMMRKLSCFVGLVKTGRLGIHEQ